MRDLVTMLWWMALVLLVLGAGAGVDAWIGASVDQDGRRARRRRGRR